MAVRGFVDQYHVPGQRVSGWAIDDSSIDKCSVVAVLDGEVIAESVADGMREDLLQAGIADGVCAFSLALPADLPEGAVVSVHEKATMEALVDGQVAVEQHQTEYVYAVDHVTNKGIAGWIFDKNNHEDKSVSLEFRAKGESDVMVAAGETTIVRPDLDGRHCGFELEFNVELLDRLPTTLVLMADGVQVADCHVLLPVNAESMAKTLEERLDTLMSLTVSRLEREIEMLRKGVNELTNQMVNGK